jgi:predicted transcriptional regulator
MHIALQPQEVEVFYLLPAIRREFAIALKALGKSQRDIAKLLGVTDAAVSQYITKKRGHDVSLPADMAKAIARAAPSITDHHAFVHEAQRALARAKEGGFLCKIHGQLADVPKGCDVCFKK